MPPQEQPRKAPPQIVAIKTYVEARANNLEKLMQGTGLNIARFMTLALNQTLQNPTLLECSKESWFDALQKCATHGLLPDAIHGALVPYKGKVTFQPMYQGLVQRAYQTKLVTKIWAEVVYEGEQCEVVLGMEPRLTHTPKPDRGESKQLIGCYACARVNGETHFAFLFPLDVARHRNASKTAGREDGPWKTHTAEMWKKTAIIVLSKTLPHFHADAEKFAEVVAEAEHAERDVIDVSFMDVAPDPVDRMKEDLRARQELRAQEPDQPQPTSTQAEEEGPGESGLDEGPETLPPLPAHPQETPPPGCNHVPIAGRVGPQLCPDCNTNCNTAQIRAGEGRAAKGKR